MTDAEGVAAVRAGAGLFRHAARAVVEIRGGDRVRWLQGQITHDVEALDPAGPASGCYATVLTVKGRIVADLHVLARPDAFWLEFDASVRDAVWQRLDRYIVADDVELVDASARFARLGLEGPEAPAVLAAASGAAPPELAAESAVELEIAGAACTVAAWGFTSLDAFQLFVPAEAAEEVASALLAAGAVETGESVLEILRVESGVPRQGAELDEEVFPAEARLDRAISIDKGCYTGQEIVERIRSRGAVNYLLVGLRFTGDAPPAAGSELVNAEGKRVGEVTSVAQSPGAGAIGLGFVRREHETPGERLRAGDGEAEVAALPLVPARAGSSPVPA